MLSLSLFVLGFTSLVAQVVLTRELMVSFYGNEFFIGWILFGWLFWVGAGSLLAKFSKTASSNVSSVLACHLLATLLVPLEIIWMRLSHIFFTVSAGQIPDFIPSMIVSFLTMMPFCLVLGFQFAVTAQCWFVKKMPADQAPIVGRSYFFETLGFVFGGVIFSYCLVSLNEFQISAILSGVNLIPVFVMLFPSGKFLDRKSFLFVACVATLASLGVLLYAQPLNIRTTAFKYPNEGVVATKNSIYGNLTVTLTGNQYNFYQNGIFAGADKDNIFNEQLVHFPMLSHPAPQKVLLIGTGFNGALNEILKHNPKQIFYGELDPALMDLARVHIPAVLRETLNDPRIHFLRGDFRHFLKSLPKDFDVAIINLPNPSTALINRYYTADFFKELRLHMKPDGVMSTHLAFSPNSVSSLLENLGVCIYRTIKDPFPFVVMLPEDTLFFLASESPLTDDPQVLIQRLQARDIHNDFVVEPYIRYRYTNDRVGKVTAMFENNKTAQKNFDLYPQGYLYNLMYWVSIFHPSLAGVFTAAAGMNCFFILFIVVLLTLFLSLNRRSSTAPKTLLMTAMFTGGFSLMSAEVLIIYAYQVFYGNLYYKIAMIIAAFMAGLAMGTFVGNRNRGASFVKLTGIHLCLGACFIFWFLLLRFAVPLGWVPSEAWWMVLALVVGALVGVEFPYANSLLLVNLARGDSFSVGIIYTADLLGSCLGALWISVFMLPAYGVYKTLVFLAVVNACIAMVLFVRRRKKE